ncbi:MAG TPA: chemotaxis protein CheB, partial [Candidatus Thermoplasmatota archaeon]|nr:chemotaxis protein CheB [Candidatus Thermoplasmatota archaeon]
MSVRLPGQAKVVVVAGSAGAFPIILRLARSLDRPAQSALFVIYHRAGDFDFQFQPFMPPDGFLAVQAREGVPVQAGRMYFPHLSDDLEVRHGSLRVHAPRQRAHPSIDRLLVSLAHEYGPRLLAVLLSGYLRDGVLGLQAVRLQGGKTIVQHPADALVQDLPTNAIRAGVADEVLDQQAILA